MTYKVLKINEVVGLTGLSKSTIYLYIQKGNFPPPIQLGERSVGWKEADLINWINEREYK